MLSMGPKPEQQLAFGVIILTAISLKGFFTHSSISKYILATLLIQSGVVDDNMDLLRQFSQDPFHSILCLRFYYLASTKHIKFKYRWLLISTCLTAGCLDFYRGNLPQILPGVNTSTNMSPHTSPCSH